MRASVLQSLRRSAGKHQSVFVLSDHSVGRILHDDLHLQPCKMAIVQELSDRNFNSQRKACTVFLEVAPEDDIVFFFRVLKSLCEPSKDLTRFKNKHPGINCVMFAKGFI